MGTGSQNGQPRTPPPSISGTEPTAVFDYLDETGALLFAVCRYSLPDQPKTFRQYGWAGDGWNKTLGDTRRVPYRLPQVLAHIEANSRDPLYIVEGEKDVHAVESAGGVATCNPMGAGKWDDSYSELLQGARRVIIVADNDDPGLAHAYTIAASLATVGVTAEITHASEGKDAADHFAARHTLDELLQHAHEPSFTPTVVDNGSFRLIVRTAREIEATPDPPQSDTLLGPFITRGERTIIVGDTGHGKTTLSLQMLAAVLLGDTLLDHEGAGEGPVMIIDLEQGRRAIKRGLREASLHERDDVLHISVPDGLALDRDAEHIAELQRVITESKPVLLLLDPYYKAHRADDSNQERPIVDLMRQLDALRTAHGFALLLPAHPRKDLVGREGTRKLTLHDIAGSGAVTRGAETVLAVERLAHGFARLRYLKDREGDLPIGEHLSLLFDKEQGFRLDPREDETDEAIEDKMLAVETGWMTATEWQKKTGIRRARVISTLANLAESGRIAFMVGPPGRSKSARCYATLPECFEQCSQLPRNTPEHHGTPAQIPIELETVPTVPPPVRGNEGEQSNDHPQETGTPEPKPDDWLDDLTATENDPPPGDLHDQPTDTDDDIPF